MNIEQQVVSLDIAKQLKEAGVEMDSEYYYSEVCGLCSKNDEPQPEDEYTIGRAYTVSELLTFLPEEVNNNQFNLIKKDNDYIASYGIERFHRVMGFVSKKPADALAKLLLKLIQEEVIKPTNL